MSTAPWTWRERGADPPIDFGPAHLDAIRALKVGFEEVENGAACVELPANSEAPEDFERAVDLFLNHATLDRFAGRVRNPYVGPDDPDLDLLQDTPDSEIRELFASGVDFDFEASPAELALFAEADLRSSGIDPKRPFGSESVGRDVKRIIDPERTLNRKQFRAARAHAESRMMVLLQFFVQNAELEPGSYARVDHEWQRLGSDGPETDMLGSDDWYWNIARDFNLQNRIFSDTLFHLHHLVWEGRIDAPYADLVQQLRLHDLYEDFTEPHFEGTTLEHALAAYDAFGLRIFAVIAVRALNATARFTEALELFVAVGRADAPPEEADLGSVSYPNLGMLEAGIARYGSGDMDADGFQRWIAGQHATNTGRSPYPFVLDMLNLQSMVDVDDPALGWHIRAACAQIAVMRGPYRPGED
ncbi:MAG: hypothetical protein AAGM22_29705 [Acidobacteriota bacterium]